MAGSHGGTLLQTDAVDLKKKKKHIKPLLNDPSLIKAELQVVQTVIPLNKETIAQGEKTGSEQEAE